MHIYICTDYSFYRLNLFQLQTYMNGMGYWLICLSICITIPMVVYIYMPIFYNLQVISVFEYLEKRFCSRALRIYALIMFVINMVRNTS